MRGVGLKALTGAGAQIDTTTANGRLAFGLCLLGITPIMRSPRLCGVAGPEPRLACDPAIRHSALSRAGVGVCGVRELG